MPDATLRARGCLTALVGAGRAWLHAQLAVPRTGAELAVMCGTTPAAASQHLQILRSTGPVRSRRARRTVWSERTDPADALLEECERYHVPAAPDSSATT